MEKNNPEALLEIEREKLREQISNFNTGLASSAGLVENLTARSKKLNAEIADLTSKTKAVLQSGRRELAAQLALRLQAAQQEHSEVVSQLEECETQYKEMIKARDIAVKTAKEKIDELSRGINDLKVKKAAAEITEMANGLISTIGSSGDTLNRLSTIVEDERNKAAGRLRVAKDSADMTEISIQEEQQNTMGEIALAQFEAELGISSPLPVESKPAKVKQRRKMNPDLQ